MTVASVLLLLLLFSSLLVMNDGSAIALFLTTIFLDFFPPNTLSFPNDKYIRQKKYSLSERCGRKERILDVWKNVSVKKINTVKSAPPPPPLFFCNFFDRDREEEEQRKDACRRPARSSCCSIFSGEETDGALCVCVNVLCGIVRIR